MAILNNSNAISSGGYDINNSLRFRSSANAFLNRTPSVAGSGTTFTLSAWVKRGKLGANQAILCTSAVLGTNVSVFEIDFTSSDTLEIFAYSAPTTNLNIITTQVFRDPSAWYHIVVVADTTQATAANRIKIYVNGTQITSFGTATYPSQNFNCYLNSTIPTLLGMYAASGYPSLAFDGYLAEVNLIDGQALTPSSFGETDTTTGSWKPKAYTGTYGTNGFYLPFKMNNSTSSYAGSFNGSSQYLSSSTALFNYTTANAATQTATIEAMVYLNSYQTPSQVYYSPCIAGKGDIYMNLGVNGSGNLIFYHYDGTARTITGSSVIPLNTWTYVAVTISGGTATIYVNGASVGSGTWYGIEAGGQSSTSYFGRAATNASALYLNGYISNLRVSSIARTISTPATSYSNDANTNFLTLQSATVVDNSTNAYAITNTGTVTTAVSYPFYTTSVSADYSGNANNWTSNNINVASSGTTYDAMIDSPTLTSATVANYCTWNPLSRGSVTSADGNLNATDSGTSTKILGTLGVSSGKWYFEVTPTSGSLWMIGVALSTTTVTSYPGQDANSWSWYSGNGGVKINNGSQVAYATYTTNDVIGVALDLDAGTLVFYKNGTSQGTAYSSLPAGIYLPTFGYNGTVALNCGQRPFAYTPPTGYVRLNTYNLPTPTILQGNKYMDATLYTGTGSAQTITNAGSFKPDFVWAKSRSSAESHRLEDSVRGATKALYSNLTNAEATEAQSITSFNSNGFSLGTGTPNTSAVTYVGWQWQAGQGSTSSNTQGTITSTVSVNATAGFSIVTYTGTGANATVGHGLGVAPKMIIIKNRINAYNWGVYHQSLGATKYINLNKTDASGTSSTYWNNTEPDSSKFYVSTSGDVNLSTNNYVAYCWAEIAGFSKFGSYTGNGSTDGPFIYTGFRPKFIITKVSSTSGYNWNMYDTSRGTYNAADQVLVANGSGAEETGFDPIDFLSNGFKLRMGNRGSNVTSATYIYMAFAENPLKNSNAR